MQITKNTGMLPYVLFICAMLYGLYLIFSLRNENTNLQDECSLLKNNLLNIENTYQELLNLEFLRYRVKNAQIENAIIYSNDGKACFLKDQLIGNRVILLYSQLTCLECVFWELEKLKLLGEKIGSENIIILASYNNKRDLNLFRRLSGLVNIPIFKISDNATVS